MATEELKGFLVTLSSIERVKEFVKIIESCPCPAYLCTGRYCVDAKSIIGIFSLDIIKPLMLRFEDGEQKDVYRELLKEFAYDG